MVIALLVWGFITIVKSKWETNQNDDDYINFDPCKPRSLPSESEKSVKSNKLIHFLTCCRKQKTELLSERNNFEIEEEVIKTHKIFDNDLENYENQSDFQLNYPSFTITKGDTLDEI